MTAFWQNDGTGWRLLAPTRLLREQTLHDPGEEGEETSRVPPPAVDPVHPFFTRPDR